MNNIAHLNSVTVTFTFGRPSNWAMIKGFWFTPKSIPGFNAEIRLIDPEKSWDTKENIKVWGMSGDVIFVTHYPDIQGGEYTVSVALIPGTETDPETMARPH